MLINNELFKLKDSDIPKIPIQFSSEALEFWKLQKKYCIEGITIGGKYMPGNLYFYINFGTIRLNKDANSKTKVLARPMLRDIEWEVFTAWNVARGLSGFSNTGRLADKHEDVLYELRHLNKDPGIPIYDNNAKNLMMMGVRGFGKSYISGVGIILHEWLFDGAKKYEIGYKDTTNIIIGAGDMKYPRETMTMAKISYDSLAKEGIMFNGKYYPHPLIKSFDGSFTNEITAKYKKKIGGQWLEQGSMSKINLVSYKDNPFAAQGKRCSVMVSEEIGMNKWLLASHQATIENMIDDSRKFGSQLFVGTGGDMGGGTLDAYKMFYDPQTYDLLEYEDVWENKGKIGLFISAIKKSKEFKDEHGNTIEEIATKHYLDERERLKRSKNGVVELNAHIQYNPLVPSEIFLRSNSSLFPISELKDHLSMLETNKKYQDSEFVCDLIFNEDGVIEPRLNPNLKALRKFPLDQKDETTGAITIFEHPKDENGEIPWGRYIAGIDPYDQNQALNSSSIGSMLVMDRWTETIVCEYSGRPSIASQFYENCRKIAIYYNCAVLYENEKTNIFHYFETKNSIKYMMKQPDYIKEVIPNSSVQRGYGMHMVEALKSRGEELARDEMLKEYQEGKLNLRKIRSIPLLQEFIMYEREGNYDRVDAFIILMFAKQEFRKIKAEAFNSQNDTTFSFFNRKLFSRK